MGVQYKVMRDGPDYVVPPSGSVVTTLTEAASRLHNAGDYVVALGENGVCGLTEGEELELRAAFDRITPGTPVVEPLSE